MKLKGLFTDAIAKIVMNGEVLEEEQLLSVKRQLPLSRSRGTWPPTTPTTPAPVFTPHLSATPAVFISVPCLSHMDQERKPKEKQFPCRPQSNFCFRQSRAERRVTSAPPQGVRGTGDAWGVGGPAGNGEAGEESLSPGGALPPVPSPARRPLRRAPVSALGFLLPARSKVDELRARALRCLGPAEPWLSPPDPKGKAPAPTRVPQRPASPPPGSSRLYRGPVRSPACARSRRLSGGRSKFPPLLRKNSLSSRAPL